jgi:phosphate transport system protein
METIQMDDQVDALNNRIFGELSTFMVEDPQQALPGLALLLTARSLERIADHATNICEEVIYMVRGQDVRHPAARAGG